MKKTLIALLGLSLVAASTITSAQQGPGPRRGPVPQQRRGPQALPPPVALLFDTEKDGVLSGDEIKAAPILLLALDANEDGKVAADELCVRAALGEEPCPVAQGLQRGKRRGANAQLPTPAGGRGLLALFDADQDGALSDAEIAAASQVLLALDANQDGQLTKDEFRPMPGCAAGQAKGARRGAGDCPFQD